MDKNNFWGLSCNVDVKNCDPEFIRCQYKIIDYVIQLCEIIDMRRYGDCQVVHFGEDEKVAGYSMVQLIETSLISGHFANQTNNAYLDIFSCKHFDPDQAAAFTKDYFKGSEVTLNVSIRK